MAVWSKVNLSEIELTRYDAEFYRPEYLAAIKKIGGRKLKSYGVSVLHPAEFVRRYEDSGLLILLAQNNRNNSYDWSTKRFASKNLASVILRNRLQYGDVTITRSGANFGQCSVIGREIDERDIFACADLLVLRAAGIDGNLVSTFFNSRIGRLLLDRGAYGGAQPHIAPTYIKEIPFPIELIAHEVEISDQVKKSRHLSKESEGDYMRAADLLESELGLDKLRFDKPIGYTTRSSDLVLSRRNDSQHYEPRFSKLLTHLSNFQSTPIRDIRSYNRRGVQPSYFKKGTHAVLNSRHLGPRHIKYDELQLTSKSAFEASPEAHIQQNDLLIYTTGAYIGRTNIYLDTSPALASNHVNILRLSHKIDPAYMAIVFQTIVGQFQTQKHARGSAQAELYPSDIDKFIVPLLPLKKQQEIGDLVRSSLYKERESKLLLEQAKSRVEQLIEEATLS